MQIKEFGDKFKKSNRDNVYIVDFDTSKDYVQEVFEIEKWLDDNGYNYKWEYSFDHLDDITDLFMDISEQGFAFIEIWEK